MKKKNAENRIIDMLTSKGDKPSLSVLEKAKHAMENDKRTRFIVKWRYAFVSLVVVIIGLAISLPFMLNDENNGGDNIQIGLQYSSYTSLNDYREEVGKELFLYSDIYEIVDVPEGGTGDEYFYPYTLTSCRIAIINSTNVFIEEQYTHVTNDIIKVYLILQNMANYDLDLFEPYSRLGESLTVGDLVINYTYNQETNTGYALLNENNNTYYIEISTQSESEMINHIEILLNL